MSSTLQLMYSQPSQRLSILTDLYHLLLDRLPYFLFGCFIDVSSLNIEEIECNNAVLAVMQNEGIISVVGDIMTDSSDIMLLV